MNAPATSAGLPAGRPSFETIRFPVTGMVCGSCVSQITRALKRLDGVDRVRVDLGREAVTVRRERSAAPNAALAAAITDAGYEPHLEEARVVDPAEALGILDRLFRRAP